MLYYKVKSTADRVRVKAKQSVNGLKYWHLIGNELYTPSEIEKRLKTGLVDLAFIRNHFVREEISPKKTYSHFGARFKCSE